MEKTPSFVVQPFGNYILLERLAVGGMAEIYKAKQSGARGFEKIVVIKKILQHLREDPEFVEMFEDEAKIASQLNQANIVQIYELGEVDEVLYITMEYVEGKNLRDVTRAIKNKDIHLSIEQCLFMITEVLKGLDYAHRKTDSSGEALRIVHRDMSPQNIVVSYEGEVKVLDFGIAKAASRISRTEAGVLKGKFSYMSPEQASGRFIDQTTDIYAVGVILHELLTSDRLFRAESDVQTLERVKAGFVPKPSEKNPLVPKALDDIVLKALAREPEDRYQTASQFLSDLTQFIFEQKLSMSSQELAAFMSSLFGNLMSEERTRLQLALEQASDPLLKNRTSGNTHIAFKSDVLSGSPEDELEEITVSNYPERKNTWIQRMLGPIIGLGILVALAILIFQGRPIKISNEETAPVEISEGTESVPNSEAPSEKDQGEASNPAELLGPPPLRTEPSEISKRPESEAGLDRILTRKDPILPPVEEEDEPLVVEEKLPPPKPKKGRINLIAPPEGYAQVYISDRMIGSVPGPRARGIELDVGEHEFRCDTPQKTYRGLVRVEENRTRSIRCQDLQADSAI
jgi:serine/threonine protein kinase